MREIDTLVDSIAALRANPVRLIPELKSLSNETNGRPDKFYLIVDEGGLRDPETGMYVRDVIERKSELAWKEAKVLDAIDGLAPLKEQGVFIWITPPHPKRSSDTKAVFYHICYLDGQKVTNGSAIRFNAGIKESLEIAHSLSGKRFDGPEQLRQEVFYFEDSEMAILNVLDLFSIYSKPENDEDPEALDQQAQLYARMIKNGVPKEEIARHMRLTRFIGSYSIGCPPTFFEYSMQNSFITKYVENCGKCGLHIGRPIPAGYHCPNCGGTYQGC